MGLKIEMNNSIPGTVCCILCRGLIIYKDGDKQRFKAHLANEHGAFFDVDYLLASCFLEPAQKEAVAMSVKMVASGFISNQPDGDIYNSNEQETLREMTNPEADVEPSQMQQMYNSSQAESSQVIGAGHGIKRERVEQFEGDTFPGEADIMAQNAKTDGNLAENSRRLKTKKNKKRKDVNAEEAVPVTNSIAEPSVSSYDNYYTSNNLENNSLESMEITAQESDPNNEITNSEENVKMEHLEEGVKAVNAGERFTCQFEGCNKSYTNASNRHTHQKKAHGWLGKRALASAKKQRMSVSEEIEEKTGINEFVDDITNPVQQENSNAIDVEDKTPGPDSTSQDGPISSFLTDTSLGFDDVSTEMNIDGDLPEEDPELKHEDNVVSSQQPEEDSVFAPSETEDDNLHKSVEINNDVLRDDHNEVVGGGNDVPGNGGDVMHQQIEEVNNQPSQPTLQVEQVDLSNSKYFEKNPKVMATARGKSLTLFDKVAEDLPPGWKQRNLEVTSKTGEKSMVNHYLAPEQKVLKTALAVVEYLRMKGEDYEKLIDIAKKLNIPEKKFSSLFT